MLPEDCPDLALEPEETRKPGPLTRLSMATIWQHRVIKSEYLALTFSTGARVVLDKAQALRLLQCLAAWLCDWVVWPAGAYPGKTAIVPFDGDLPKEAKDDIPF